MRHNEKDIAKTRKTLDGAYATQLDRIIANFKYGDKYCPLPEETKKLLERWNFADNLLRKGYTNAIIVDMIAAKFNVSLPTAYRDITDAKNLFGSLTIEDKTYDKKLQLEWLNKAITLAFSRKDPKGIAALLKERRLLLGLDKMDDATLTPDKLGGNVIYIIAQTQDKQPELINIDNLQKIDDQLIDSVLTQADITNLDEEAIRKLLVPNGSKAQ